MRSSVRIDRILPALLGGILCCVLTGLLAHSIRVHTDGLFVYPLDDSYIHLALARTVAIDHIWGMSAAGFASASSSPGWTLLLSLTNMVFGSHLATPIVINLIMVFILLFVVDSVLLSIIDHCPRWLRYCAILVVAVGTPLPCSALLGMEHVAQALSILLLVYFGTRILSIDPSQPIERGLVLSIVASGCFAGAIRYEAVFAAVPVILLLLFRKRYKIALLLGLSTALAPIAFGVFFYHHSSSFLPFSVLVKASQRAKEPAQLLHMAAMILGKKHTPFISLLFLAWLLRLSRKSFWQPVQLFIFLAASLSLEHILVAPVGWLMRYESYFVSLDLLAIFLLLSDTEWPRSLKEVRLIKSWRLSLTAVSLLFAALSINTLFVRAYEGETLPVKAAVDRYDEHIQMARFIAKNFDNDAIVLDDIGAVAFYTHAHILDMVGLGSIEPLLPARDGRGFTSADMSNWAKAEGAKIAIIQDGQPNIKAWTPPSWTLVQRWKQPRNVVFYDLTTSLFAIDTGEIPELCKKLSDFPLTTDDRVIYDRCAAP